MLILPNKLMTYCQFFTALLLLCLGNIYSADDMNLTFNETLNLAQKNDPWLTANRYSQEAIESMSVVASSYSDPTISLGFANIPTDSFDFNQEAMTQIKIGITQVFPRGDSLSIKQKQLLLQGSQYPYLRQDRKAKVKVSVGQLWLKAYKAQESIALIESNRSLFEQLSEVAESRYASALGKTRQQDIVRAQLELTRLEDRLTVFAQQLTGSKQQLMQWTSQYFISQGNLSDEIDSSFTLGKELPDLTLVQAQLFNTNQATDQQLLLGFFSVHPAILALGQKIKASSAGIELVKQKYKPQWAVNANYGLRQETLQGIDRSDFFSIGVSFDLPFFTANRQDQEVKAAVSKNQSIKTEKWLLLRKLYTAFEASKAQLQRATDRQRLYRTKLLPQIHEQAEASLTAYTNNDGDFAEVVRARIAVLNAEIDALGIRVDKQLAIIQLNYFFETGYLQNNNSSGEIQ